MAVGFLRIEKWIVAYDRKMTSIREVAYARIVVNFYWLGIRSFHIEICRITNGRYSRSEVVYSRSDHQYSRIPAGYSRIGGIYSRSSDLLSLERGLLSFGADLFSFKYASFKLRFDR